jgi:transglutaminase-like putative cysteine protease
MSRTWLSVTAALLLAAGSLTLALVRRSVLGHEVDGPGGASGWKVTLVVTGAVTGKRPSLTMSLPRSFRHQHVFDEEFQSAELVCRLAGGTDSPRRAAVWTRNFAAARSFRVSYSFRCLVGLRETTPTMRRLTRLLDRPDGGESLRPSPRVQSEDRQVIARARELAPDAAAPLDKARALLDYVEGLESEPAFDTQTAVDCLRAGSGDSGGKARLLVALCRSRGIPARLLGGLVLKDERDPNLRYWAEAWINGHWLPLDPLYGYFGTREFPSNYLVLHVGDEPPVRGHGLTFQYRFHTKEIAEGADDAGAPGALKSFFRQASLHALPPAEQQVVKFLLLLPLAALIASFVRTVVGLPTFGTFAPALLGLIFVDTRALAWGLLLFLSIVLVAWGMRKLLEPFRLLQVPRISVLLTLIIVFLIAMIVVAHRSGIAATHYVSLFPLIILTHMVERFWTMEVEDSPSAALRTLLSTLLVVIVISLACSPRPVSAWLFRYPETLGAVLAVQLVLGRYTGYRLTELYRFRDLMDSDDKVTG